MADGEPADRATLTRQVRVRAAHRGAVTRLQNQLDEVLPMADVNRLRQLRQSLTTKMEILARMDEEILALVDEDQVEGEIEQSDFVREKAELAVITIDEALTSLPMRTSSKKRTPSIRDSSSSPTSDADDINPKKRTPSNCNSSSSDADDINPILKDTAPPRSSASATTENPSVTFQPFNFQPSVTSTSLSSTPWTFTFPSISSLRDSLPAVTSSPPSNGTLTAKGEHSSGTLAQIHGEYIPSVCPTYITSDSMHGSITMTSPSDSRAYRPSLAYDPLSSMPTARASGPLPTIPEMTVPRGPPPLIPSTVHGAEGLPPDVHPQYTSLPTTDATASAHVTTYSAPSHASLNPSTYLTTPLMAHTQTVAPGLNMSTIAPGACTSSAGSQVRVTDQYQGLSAASSTAPTLSLPIGLTHTPMAPMSTGVAYYPTHVVPTTTPYNPIGTSAPHVKLPKLSLKRFNGDLTKWTTFWDSFSSSIHGNPALSRIDKFNYLISLLESTAAEAIAGLTPTDANYEEAVSV